MLEEDTERGAGSLEGEGIRRVSLERSSHGDLGARVGCGAGASAAPIAARDGVTVSERVLA